MTQRALDVTLQIWPARFCACRENRVTAKRCLQMKWNDFIRSVFLSKSWVKITYSLKEKAGAVMVRSVFNSPLDAAVLLPDAAGT